MQAITDRPDDPAEEGPRLSWADARDEDAFWQRRFWQEHYYRWDLDYEDYAPAYCVGYVGRVQYGDDFEQAERSLCANWERIRGGSRLTWPEAMLAIRAAWQRVGRQRRAAHASRSAPAWKPVREEGSLAIAA